MQVDEHKNTPQWYKQNLYESLNTWLKRTKKSLKSRFLAVKRRLLGLKNYEMATNLERLNGAKCSFCSQK